MKAHARGAKHRGEQSGLSAFTGYANVTYGGGAVQSNNGGTYAQANASANEREHAAERAKIARYAALNPRSQSLTQALPSLHPQQGGYLHAQGYNNNASGASHQ